MSFTIIRKKTFKSYQCSERGRQVNGENGWVLRYAAGMGKGDMEAERMLLLPLCKRGREMREFCPDGDSHMESESESVREEQQNKQREPSSSKGPSGARP